MNFLPGIDMFHKRCFFTQPNRQLRKRSRFWKICLLFLAILYVGYLSLDFCGLLDYGSFANISSILKWFSIFLLFLIQLFYFQKSVSAWILAAGLTCVADYALLFSDYFSFGVFVFILTQAARCFFLNKKVLLKILPFGLLLFVLLDLLSNRLFALSGVYALFLLMNFILAFRKREKPLIWGFLLFILCDLNVAVFNITSSGMFYQLAAFLMWFFYLPSQVLLADYLLTLSGSEANGG